MLASARLQLTLAFNHLQVNVISKKSVHILDRYLNPDVQQTNLIKLLMLAWMSLNANIS